MPQKNTYSIQYNFHVLIYTKQIWKHPRLTRLARVVFSNPPTIPEEQESSDESGGDGEAKQSAEESGEPKESEESGEPKDPAEEVGEPKEPAQPESVRSGRWWRSAAVPGAEVVPRPAFAVSLVSILWTWVLKNIMVMKHPFWIALSVLVFFLCFAPPLSF